MCRKKNKELEDRVTDHELNGNPRAHQSVPHGESLEFNGNRGASQLVSQVESPQTDAEGEDSGTDAASGDSWATVTRLHQPVQSHSPTTQPTWVQKTEKRQNNIRRKNFGQQILDTRQDGNRNTTIKYVVPIIQMTVVRVNNPHPDCTPTLLTDYLLAADIQVGLLDLRSCRSQDPRSKSTDLISAVASR